jgi:cellulose biosynthesis protein BcsQ
MKVISVVASKGGVGKTTVSNVISGLLVEDGFNVELWDTDCNQYSSETMSFSNLLDYEVLTVPDTKTLKELLNSSTSDYVVIDTAPHSHDSELFIQILNATDLVIGITRPLPNDVFAFEKIMLPVLSKTKSKKTLLINQRNHIQSSIQKESEDLIKNRINSEINVLNTALHNRASYAAIGYFETDSKIDKKRIDEAKALYQELKSKDLL